MHLGTPGPSSGGLASQSGDNSSDQGEKLRRDRGRMAVVLKIKVGLPVGLPGEELQCGVSSEGTEVLCCLPPPTGRVPLPRRWAGHKRGLSEFCRRGRGAGPGAPTEQEEGDLPQSGHQHHEGLVVPASLGESLQIGWRWAWGEGGRLSQRRPSPNPEPPSDEYSPAIPPLCSPTHQSSIHHLPQDTLWRMFSCSMYCDDKAQRG